MRIKSLTLKNYRLFGNEVQTLNFAEDKNITVIVGNNGSGKSSILDAISCQISTMLSQFPGKSAKNYSEYDVHIESATRRADFLSVESLLHMRYNGDIKVLRTRKGMGKSPESEIKELKSYADTIVERVNSGDNDCVLPILAYYGTGRGQITAPERKTGFQQVFSRWDAYDSALDASTNFKRFFSWYDLMETEELKEMKRLGDLKYTSPILNVVRKALLQFVGSKFSNPRIETRPLRFAMDEKLPDGNVRELRIEQMSDGFKIVTAMVADIASRMAEANPGMENPLDASGIVLIDEIDLHLHVQWQRSILKKLSEVFPHIQFIVTTHSPIILSGAVDNAQFVLLSGNCIKDLRAADYSRYDISQLLLSNIFDLPSIHSQAIEEQLKRQEELLAKQKLTGKETEELNTLNDQLSTLPLGTTLESMKVNKMIQEIAHQMGLDND